MDTNRTDYRVCVEIKQAVTASGFQIEHFTARTGEAWCVLGVNRSGTGDFMRLLSTEQLPVSALKYKPNTTPALVSFAGQQCIFEAELYKDETDFLDYPDPGTPAREFIPENHRSSDLIEAFGLTAFLHQGYRELSTGQARKLLLLAQAVQKPDCLIIEAPYDGLDRTSRTELNRCLTHLLQRGCCVILFIADHVDLPDWATHLALVDHHKIVWQGRRSDLSPRRIDEICAHPPDFRPEISRVKTRSDCNTSDSPLVELHNGWASYRGVDVFRRLNLTIRPGDHTLITGANGSGKSTLLQLISGDHQDCYRNNLYLFGKKRGSGETIWELKHRMGIVSPDLHRNYYIGTSVLSCIVSGLFDSIGVYRKPKPEQVKLAEKWLNWTGLEKYRSKPFRSLSYADQRLLLIARALIKSPPLLLLDEPTHGLDAVNRGAVLDFIEEIAHRQISTILYAGHRHDEYRPFFIHRLTMDEYMVGE